ncbi:MAG: HAD family phosphatase [Lawsonibacter sp.]|nr:HAD family phosphatase [Lawsonibacter sp.]
MSESIRGVVFDVDGVLFDTERLTFRTWTEVGAQMGWPQTGERYLEFVGQNRTDILRKMELVFGPQFPGAEFMAACSERSQQRMEREGCP